MRITESMITRGLLQSLNSSKSTMNKTQTSISTAKQFQEASDDPISFVKAQRLQATLAKNNQYLSNISDASGWVESTSDILDNINDNLLTVKDLVVSAADYSAGQSTRDTIGDQINDILEEIVSLSNSTYNDKYIFGGTVTRGNEPFSFDGSAVTYSGNSEKISRRIAENYDVDINVAGSDLVTDDVFSSLISLRDALYAGDTTAISDAVSQIDTVSDSVISMSTAMGSLQNQITLTQNRLESANVNLESYLSQIQDTDMVEAITKYNSEEIAYEAALQATSDSINLNILSFLS